MTKTIWHASLSVTTYRRSRGVERIPIFSFNDVKFEAKDIAEAKKNLLSWARKKLSRFSKGKNRTVMLICGPEHEKEKDCLDADKMLRNRYSHRSISSILRGSADKIFVEGYGSKARAELSR
ncbi:MAG: hypothetical protein WC847_02600 [Candidatus Paceibacterota bacterium]|jgi:fatty acid-binding protein DegV